MGIGRHKLLTLVACAFVTVAALPAPAGAEGSVPGQPAAPAADDPRFLAGSVGPVVPRGAAPNVVLPDGEGFFGEGGRLQNAVDVRRNNYSVRGANFTNYLGLLPRHPDSGTPLTYVQHVQAYAAAGYVQAFAPHVYAHMVARQEQGHGTVLGAASYLMGLVKTRDAAALGVDAGSIPPTLPGSPVLGRAHVRSGRDATGQEWARMHHALSAPLVYRALVEAGVPWQTALVLSGDDAIAGAGRFNGLNEQGGTTGMGDDERAVWSIAALLQQSTGVPVVEIMMSGHSHTTLHATALTFPRMNPMIGFASDDRSSSPERVAAIYQVLLNGRLGSATRAADPKFKLTNPLLLDMDGDIAVDLGWPAGMPTSGELLTISGAIANSGVQATEDVKVRLRLPPHLAFVSASVGSVRCQPTGTCDVADVWAGRSAPVTIVVRVRGAGSTMAILVEVESATGDRNRGNNLQSRSLEIWSGSNLTGELAPKPGKRGLRCGATLRRSCTVTRTAGFVWRGVLGPIAPGDKARAVEVTLQRRLDSGRWKTTLRRTLRLHNDGRYAIQVTPEQLRAGGRWRVMASADGSRYTGAAAAPWRYVRVR